MPHTLIFDIRSVKSSTIERNGSIDSALQFKGLRTAIRSHRGARSVARAKDQTRQHRNAPAPDWTAEPIAAIIPTPHGA